ncbi:Unknown protein sequence [Pseudomonas savastanoi pv. glycinea]|uniref:Uncharacterized protein n=1 Tax=Pseudomonas savastanoi pv. glycinea TaxID=318 RepID=A0ABR5LGP4_PSESG|nr:Unknown protein sequence [Pseudomonas savastanoi pv. glycinea]KPC47091.1 Unknown protein sequence [Pseudomonas savastanoi pv. glycinea]
MLMKTSSICIWAMGWPAGDGFVEDKINHIEQKVNAKRYFIYI